MLWKTSSKKLYNPYSVPWRRQLYLYSFWQSLVGLYCIPMAPLPSHVTLPSSFKSVIISSSHGWLILSLHPFLNRCLDSSDSLRFHYHQPTLCFNQFSSFFKKLHKSSAVASCWCAKLQKIILTNLSMFFSLSIPMSLTHSLDSKASKHVLIKGETPLLYLYLTSLSKWCSLLSQFTYSSPKRLQIGR